MYILWCVTLPILDFCVSSFNGHNYSAFHSAASLFTSCSPFFFKMPLHISVLQVPMCFSYYVFLLMSTCLCFWEVSCAPDVISAHLIIHSSIVLLCFFRFSFFYLCSYSTLGFFYNLLALKFHISLYFSSDLSLKHFTFFTQYVFSPLSRAP